MGADEKHAATYLGGEYTPSVNDLAGKCINDDNSIRFTPEMFDRAIARIRAEAKAEAYKDAERILHEEARWQLDLHQHHKEYRFKHCSERMTEMENCMTIRADQYKETQ